MASFSIQKRSTTVGNTDTYGTIQIRFVTDKYNTLSDGTTGVSELGDVIKIGIPYLE